MRRDLYLFGLQGGGGGCCQSRRRHEPQRQEGGGVATLVRRGQLTLREGRRQHQVLAEALRQKCILAGGGFQGLNTILPFVPLVTRQCIEKKSENHRKERTP